MSSDSTTRSGAVAQNYARAVFDLAIKADQADAVLLELQRVRDAVASSADLRTVLEHPLIDTAKRGQSLRKIFAGQVSDLTLRFLLVLNRKRRFAELAGVVAAFDHLLKAMRKQIDVEVVTARPLDAAQMAAVGDRLSAALGLKAVVHPRVDPSLIGGLKVLMGDRVIDASVATRLRRLSRNLIDTGYDSLRKNADRLLTN